MSLCSAIDTTARVLQRSIFLFRPLVLWNYYSNPAQLGWPVAQPVVCPGPCGVNGASWVENACILLAGNRRGRQRPVRGQTPMPADEPAFCGRAQPRRTVIAAAQRLCANRRR